MYKCIISFISQGGKKYIAGQSITRRLYRQLNTMERLNFEYIPTKEKPIKLDY